MASLEPQESPTREAPARLSLPRGALAGCLLAWWGVLACLLLLQRHAALRDLLCPARKGCETVLSSPFATIGGVPLSVLGAVYYLGILGLFLSVVGSSSTRWRQRALEGALWVLVVGATFSAGLMYLQFAVLRAFCPLCTLSAVITGALIAVTMQTRRAVQSAGGGGSRRVAATLALFALFPAIILLVSGAGPTAPRPGPVRLDLALAQISGPREARAQLVVFSDYQCSFCRQFAPVLRRIREEFPDQVMVAYRDYPLENHPRAFPAAVAAHCAGEQGAFWPYHDRLYAEGGDLSDATFLKLAEALGLDRDKFSACLKSESASAAVRASQEDAIRNGLEGVPAVFLNGRPVEGGWGYENLVRRIRSAIQAGAPPAVTPAR